MDKIRQIILDHWLAIILAIFVSLLVAFPQIYFRIEHRNDGIYQGIELLPDSPWSARVREIQDGHGFGSIYYKDGKDDPYLHTPLGSMVVAHMGKAFGLDINNTLLLSRLTLSFLAFLFIYIFVYLFSKDKLASLASAAVILLADSLLDYSGIPRLLSDAMQGISPSSFLEITRPVYSLMIFVPFFAFLITFWKFFQKKNVWWGVVSVVLLGSSFYNYFYLWSYLYAFGAVLIITFIIRKRWPEALRLGYVYLGGLAVGIPYAINLYRAQMHPLYEELGMRHGIVTTHEPMFIGVMAFAALVIFLISFPREDKDKYFFGLALLLTPFITLNQQVITGMVLQTGHYHWYFHKPIAVIFLLLAIFYFLRKYNWFSTRRILAILIILVSFATGIFVQAVSYFNDEGRDGGYIAIERQKYGPVVKWLSENAGKESVVLANNEASQMTVIYTPLNVFHHRSSQLFLSATEERLLEAMFTFYRLNGVGENEIEKALSEDVKWFSASVYGIYYREVHGSYGAIPDEKFKEIVKLYKEFLHIPLQEIFDKYEVDYIIWDKIKDPLWKLDRFNYLEKVAEFNNIVIYRVI